jgi:hypothetical protein
MGFECPELAAWLAGRHLGSEGYIQQYGETRRIYIEEN